ncbi:hypothetical protein DPMN_118086 [Dreissena polymorpha]|uniref:Uncharacterized protein n=1 Tax=Dreissena polymorpha TaxID=45954 RepID=A0A9D4GJI4_DREPO|nr:hypothetical protein DPMN_118086 [Dreissena polymorpha]
MVDLDCLTASSEELLIRCTDTTWVRQIKESMRSQPSRPVTRIPVLCERERFNPSKQTTVWRCSVRNKTWTCLALVVHNG